MPTMSTVRAGGIAGIAFIVLTVVASLIAPVPPSADKPAAEFLEYLTDNRTSLMIQSSLQACAVLVFLFFLPGFRRWLGGDKDVATTAVVALAGGWALAAAVSMMSGGLAYVSETTLGEDDARNLLAVFALSFTGILVVLGSGSALAGVLLLRRQGAARIAGALGVVVAVLAVIMSFAWADSGFFSPGVSTLLAYVGTLLFTLFVSILMLRSPKAAA